MEDADPGGDEGSGWTPGGVHPGGDGQRGVHRRRGAAAGRDRDHRPRRAEGGERTVTDGPFAESKEVLGGFYLLECADLDEALEWAKKVPVPGGAVEVRPVMDYEGGGYEGAVLDSGGPRLLNRAADQVVDRLFRHESGRAVASLIRVLGDFDAAEEAVQEAFVVALERWPRDGTPDNPGAWITRVARNKAIDRLRRERTLELKKEVLEGLERLAPDSEEIAAGARGRAPGRPPAPDLHLLPSGAAASGARRPHPADPRRPHHR